MDWDIFVSAIVTTVNENATGYQGGITWRSSAEGRCLSKAPTAVGAFGLGAPLSPTAIWVMHRHSVCI